MELHNGEWRTCKGYKIQRSTQTTFTFDSKPWTITNRKHMMPTASLGLAETIGLIHPGSINSYHCCWKPAGQKQGHLDLNPYLDRDWQSLLKRSRDQRSTSANWLVNAYNHLRPIPKYLTTVSTLKYCLTQWHAIKQRLLWRANNI